MLVPQATKCQYRSDTVRSSANPIAKPVVLLLRRCLLDVSWGAEVMRFLSSVRRSSITAASTSARATWRPIRHPRDGGWPQNDARPWGRLSRDGDSVAADCCVSALAARKRIVADLGVKAILLFRAQNGPPRGRRQQTRAVSFIDLRMSGAESTSGAGLVRDWS